MFFQGLLLGLGMLAGASVFLVARQRRRQAAEHTGQMLLQATEAGDVAEMETLLHSGATVNARNAHGWTSLHVAAAGGDPAVVALLLRYGADVHVQSYIGTTPLDTVTMRGGNRVIIDLLRAHGATGTEAWDGAL